MSLSLPVIFYANLLESYLDKIKYVHDYLCLSIDYDKTAFDSGDYGGKLQTAYSAVVSTRRCFSKWNFCQWRNAVGCLSGISASRQEFFLPSHAESGGQIFVWSLPEAKSGSRQMFFRSPAQMRASNGNFFPVQARIRLPNKCFFVPRRKCGLQTNVFSLPGANAGFQTKIFCSADAKAVKKQKFDARADAKSPSERKDAI